MAKDLQISIRVDEETREKLLRLCELEHRSQSDEFAYLVDCQYARCFQGPNPLVMVEDLTPAPSL